MSISNWSRNQDKNILFLRTLKNELEKFVATEKEKIKTKEPEEKRINEFEIMFKVEKLKRKKIKDFCVKNFEKINKNQNINSSTNKSSLTKQSNYSYTVLNRNRKTLNYEDMTKININRRRSDRPSQTKISLYEKRLSMKHEIGMLNIINESKDQKNNRIKNSKMVFNKEINKTIKKNDFKLDKEEIDNSDLSEIYSLNDEEDSNSESTSILSEEKNPVNDLDYKIKICEDFKDLFIFKIVKQKNKILNVNNRNQRLNLLSFLKGELRNIDLEDDEYNYCFFSDYNGFLKNKIVHIEINEECNEFKEYLLFDNNQMEEEIEESDKVSIFLKEENEKNEDNLIFDNKDKNYLNFYYSLQSNKSDYKYSSLIKKNMILRDLTKFEENNINERNILKFDFLKELKDHYKLSIKGGYYGAFLNLDQNRFKSKLLLKKGNLFMINSKRGFYISSIFKKGGSIQRTEFLTNNKFILEYNPINFLNEKSEEFYLYLLEVYKKEIEKDEEIMNLDYKKNDFRKIFNEFCHDYLIKNYQSFICLEFVEFNDIYKIYRTKKKCLLFSIENINEFFLPINNSSYNYSFGDIIYKNNKEANFFLSNSISNFNAPYNLNINFENENYFLNYSQYNNLELQQFDLYSQDIKNCIKFSSDNDKNFKEGIWIGLTQFDIFQNEFVNNDGVLIPFDSYILYYAGVFNIEKMRCQICKEDN